MSRFVKIIAGVTLVLAVSGCKTPGSSSRVKDGDGNESVTPECALNDKTWAGRMGMRLVDGGGSAAIECVKLGEGLVQIGLRAGDRITALNGGAKVDSAAGFETVCTKIAKETRRRVRQWEFQVERDGQSVAVKPKAAFPGCTLFAYEDCGPLSQ